MKIFVVSRSFISHIQNRQKWLQIDLRKLTDLPHKPLQKLSLLIKNGQNLYWNLWYIDPKSFFLQIAAVLAAVSADPYYGYGQYSWPSAYAPGFSSTCYGCRGKRSAEPEPEPYYGYYGYGPGIAYHGYGATSYTQRSPQGIGKRSAEPEPHYYGGYGYHPYGGSSYVGRTIWGLRGKTKMFLKYRLVTISLLFGYFSNNYLWLLFYFFRKEVRWGWCRARIRLLWWIWSWIRPWILRPWIRLWLWLLRLSFSHRSAFVFAQKIKTFFENQ